ncbi:threonine/homoserine/homoserine lactone efflux protein [Paenibacillus sp. SORGH_AS306]|uniref:LysE family translocator n=1 Tax=unclassified Paenibacillus TaxID=185978 RepID=UPI002780D2BF|nr:MULTISPECIES: LysE family translocator [unclassified Paenibacillus]MDQ1236758.1 threonine/homoserine/homoserine lactone efflux protein [Paenibacillus sp. SORGH_AS_0306]MDR6109115.1 threonine/homoserine/homoserine lactone efflux protein [Paenibacillus sp. SORGH_AS_0338]
MISFGTMIAFAAVALGMVCAPGPNMIYLISRSVTQGRVAGVISLFGVVLAFVVYIVATMMGLSALFLTVPVLYTMIKWAGAVYLLWLAWKAIRPGSDRNILEPQALTIESPKKLFMMGFMTNLLNPKAAVLYVSLLPQFIDPARGSVLMQSATLGLIQISISFIINLLIVLVASQVVSWFGKRPIWLRVQRWVMASVLTALAARMALDRK